MVTFYDESAIKSKIAKIIRKHGFETNVGILHNQAKTNFRRERRFLEVYDAWDTVFDWILSGKTLEIEIFGRQFVEDVMDIAKEIEEQLSISVNVQVNRETPLKGDNGSTMWI